MAAFTTGNDFTTVANAGGAQTNLAGALTLTLRSCDNRGTYNTLWKYRAAHENAYAGDGKIDSARLKSCMITI
jgi:hypothetical protein